MMITVPEKEYWEMKKKFFNKYPIEQIITSAMDENGGYHKTYLCEKNVQWFEVYSYCYETKDVEVEIKNCKVKQEISVKLFRTEFWNTKTGNSYLTYELA